jgi:hypothetical protein
MMAFGPPSLKRTETQKLKEPFRYPSNSPSGDPGRRLATKATISSFALRALINQALHSSSASTSAISSYAVIEEDTIALKRAMRMYMKQDKICQYVMVGQDRVALQVSTGTLCSLDTSAVQSGMVTGIQTTVVIFR